MKVVLTQDIAHVGKKGESVEISNGYGINYLIPKKMALKADSPEGLVYLKQVESKNEARSQAEEENKAEVAKLAGQQFSFPVEANESGVLFAGLTPAKVAEMINAMAKTELTAKNIKPDDQIKEVGEYNASLIAAGEKVGEIMINVTTDKA
tara:strand:- start:682 stop:1134 length:453 start_codon:yes stop_codon:yes gene_type:complete